MLTADHPSLFWKLITNLTVETHEDAVRKLCWYGRRWSIEAFFKTLKSACRVEEVRFTTPDRLTNRIALCCIVAWRIHWMMMQRHLDEIALTVDPGAHALLMLDQAGWHTTDKLILPNNITLLPLPPKAPELNPAENVWQFMRENWLSNRVFLSYDEILEHCCDAWNKLIDEPWCIMSLGLPRWAHQ